MEKVITFTADEKSLIYQRFVQPLKGTEAEAKHFIEVCENFGLNPLLGDIVFQRYETKNGPKTQFITTRDGLLRVASRQPDYVGAPNANVVREGDVFKFLPSEGKVHHEFGQKRGNILGAYAVMRHKRFDPVAVFVDFQEYYQANSGKINSRYGNSNTWDTMPSAMIQKIAEVFVLRRQFPLGGLYTKEEMALEDNEQPEPQPTETEPTNPEVKQDQPNVPNSVSYVTKEQADELASLTNELSKLRNVSKEKFMGALQIKAFEQLELNQYNPIKTKLENWLEQAKAQTTENIEKEPKQNGEPVSSPKQATSENATKPIVIQNIESGQSPTGESYYKLYTDIDGKNTMIFARGEKAKLAENLQVGDTVNILTSEQNGFTFLVEAEKVKQSA